MGSYLLICETQSLTYLWHQGGGSVCFKEALLEGISAWTLKGGWSPSSSPQVLYLSTSNKRWNQTLRQLGHSSFWILMPRGSPVLVMIFEFSIGVSLRIAHRNFLLKTLRVIDTYLFFRTVYHVTFLTLWDLNFFLWASPRCWYLLAKLRFRNLSSHCSNCPIICGFSLISAWSPGRTYWMPPDAECQILLRWNTFPGVFKLLLCYLSKSCRLTERCPKLDNHLAMLKFPKETLVGA